MKQIFEIKHDRKGYEGFQIAYAIDVTFQDHCSVTEITKPNMDKCRWTFGHDSGTGWERYKTECGQEYYAGPEDFKFCPYCGKPIEVVDEK